MAQNTFPDTSLSLGIPGATIDVESSVMNPITGQTSERQVVSVAGSNKGQDPLSELVEISKRMLQELNKIRFILEMDLVPAQWEELDAAEESDIVEAMVSEEIDRT